MGMLKNQTDLTWAVRKAKKRKLEEAVPDLPLGTTSTEIKDSFQLPQETSSKPSKKRKRNKFGSNNATDIVAYHQTQFLMSSRRNSKIGEATDGIDRDGPAGFSDGFVANKPIDSKNAERPGVLTDSHDVDPVHSRTGSASVDDGVSSTKSKKERKTKRKTNEATNVLGHVGPSTSPFKDITVIEKEGSPIRRSKNNRNRARKRSLRKDSGAAQRQGGKAPRFIVFVGNLPFSATTESIQKHFAAVHPKYIRHLTKKDNPAESRGCAFIEFDGYDHMKACLKSFHHSMFEDGISAARKINVELTAGGGGNKPSRQAKIDEKNQKLNQERTRRIQEEVHAKLVKKSLTIDHNDIHPSRRSLVPNSQ